MVTAEGQYFVNRLNVGYLLFYRVILAFMGLFLTEKRHPVYFQKTSAAPFGNRSPQPRGAWSAHEQTCKISREELPHPLKQRQDELRNRNFFVSLPLW